MDELIHAINGLSFWIATLCGIQWLHLLFKDTSGSGRLEKIEKAIRDLISEIRLRR